MPLYLFIIRVFSGVALICSIGDELLYISLLHVLFILDLLNHFAIHLLLRRYMSKFIIFAA